jgi:hypothetical protein
VQWLTYLLIGIPLYLLGEAFFGWLFSPEHGRRISSRSFSPARILVAIPAAAIAIVLAWLFHRLVFGGAV